MWRWQRRASPSSPPPWTAAPMRPTPPTSPLTLCGLRRTAVIVGGVATAVLGSSGRRAGVLFAASAGMLWAASDTTIKALSDALGEEGWAAIVFSPMALLILLLSLGGLLVSARSLQIGPVVPVIAVTSVAANALTIAAGPIVFAEPLPDDTLALDRPRARLRPGDLRRRPDPAAAARRGARTGLVVSDTRT